MTSLFDSYLIRRLEGTHVTTFLECDDMHMLSADLDSARAAAQSLKGEASTNGSTPGNPIPRTDLEVTG